MPCALLGERVCTIFEKKCACFLWLELAVSGQKTLTEANAGEQAEAALRRKAGGEQGLEDVVGKGQRDHGLIGRVYHQQGDPQTQEPEKKNEWVVRNLASGGSVRQSYILCIRPFIPSKRVISERL